MIFKEIKERADQVYRDWVVRKDNWLLAACVLALFFSLISAVFVPPQRASAISGFIDPGADGTSSSYTLTGGSTHAGVIGDGTRQPTTPNTGNHISAAANSNASVYLRMSSLTSVQSVSQITVWAYHNDATNAQFNVQLYDDDESTTRSALSNLPQISSDGWNSVTFSGLSLTQAQLDSLSVRIGITKNGGGQPDTGTMYAMYADVTYSAGPIISLTTDGSVAFGAQAPGSTTDTTASGLNDVQTVSVDGDPINLDVRSTSFSDGGNTWSLGASAGSNQVLWEFSPDGSGWTTFAASGTLYNLATNVPSGATRNLYLRLTAPTSSASFTEHSATVTIVASVP